jgi:NAD(P)H-hydrate repair Nnr-like enzyme with NAD(P)H-hydrate dehydratase domain
MSLVGDADFLWFLSNSLQASEFTEKVKLIQHRAILTPNIVEFDRLAK